MSGIYEGPGGQKLYGDGREVKERNTVSDKQPEKDSVFNGLGELRESRVAPPVPSEDAREWRELFTKARKVVSELCRGTRDWTMQIPANHNEDPDLIITDALVAAELKIISLEQQVAAHVASRAAQKLDMSFVEKVENEIGMGHGAWDMENPVALCEAVIKVHGAAQPDTRKLAEKATEFLNSAGEHCMDAEVEYQEGYTTHDLQCAKANAIFAVIPELERILLDGGKQ